MMGDSDLSSFDGIKVDFDEDIDLAQSDTSFEIPDQGGGPASATSPSLITTRSATLWEKGPNLCHNTSNWVLGVKHHSLYSDRLNERMANRAMNSSNCIKFNMSDKKIDFDNVQKRQFGAYASKVFPLSTSYPMDDIIEVSAESFDNYHSHQPNLTYPNTRQFIGVAKNKEKRQHVVPAKQIFSIESNYSQQNCAKYVCQPNNHKVCRALSINNGKILIDIPFNSESTLKNDFVNEENEIKKIKSEKRTKTSDKSHKQNKSTDKNFSQITSTENESSNQIKSSIKLSSNYKRSVNLVTLSAKQELQRYRRQLLCESVSLIIIIIGIILVTITPFLLIPIWVIPNEYSPLIRNFLWLSLLTSVILLSLAALTGNIYWYYDEKSQKLKWFYHCGKGPSDHYWGATLLHNHKPFNIKNEANVSINV